MFLYKSLNVKTKTKVLLGKTKFIDQIQECKNISKRILCVEMNYVSP